MQTFYPSDGCANRKLTTLSTESSRCYGRAKNHNQGGEELLKMDQYEFIRTAHRVYDKNISDFSDLFSFVLLQ